MVNQLTDKRRKKVLDNIAPINTAVSTAALRDSAPESRRMKLSAVLPRQKGTLGFRKIAAAKPDAAEAAQAASIFHPQKGTAGLLQLSGTDMGNQPKSASSSNSVGTDAVGGNAVDNSENSGGGGNSGAAGGSDSFEDYYTRLLETLHGYGVALTLPTLEELYSQLEQFLRPAVDSAIENRREHGETTLAELDADAYSRGMGGSTYLSGMKRREYNAVAADIAMLEANYNAQLAKYFYEATQELASIQQSFAEMQLRHRQDMQKLRAQQAGRSSGSGKSGGKGGGGNGNSGSSGSSSYPDGSGKYYNYYCAYLSHLSAQNIDNVFFSNSSEWTAIREQMRQRLGNELYELIMNRFVPQGT